MLSYLKEGLVGDLNDFPTEFDVAVKDYYYEVEKFMEHYWDTSVKGEKYGFENCIDYKQIQDFMLLAVLYSIAYWDKEDTEHFNANNCPEAVQTYRDKYKLDCVRKYFSCYNFDTKTTDNIFGLLKDCDSGIGCMAIEQTTCTYPIFTIR